MLSGIDVPRIRSMALQEFWRSQRIVDNDIRVLDLEMVPNQLILGTRP